MLIFAIDDEPKQLQNLHAAITEAVPGAELRDYQLGSAALNAIQQEGLRPDVVFSDIRMPGVSGLELAVRVKSLSPDSRVVFVTGYDDYALEAYRRHVNGYLLKPVEAAHIREELEALDISHRDRASELLRVKCFGYFEVFWKGEPLSFSRSKTKELFAFLVDRGGSTCQPEEVIAALFEKTEPEKMKQSKQNLRNLVNDLKRVLTGIGQGEVLIRKGSSLCIRPELLDCDYYRMLSGDMAALNRFRGAYMEQYTWAEMTKGVLKFRI